MALLSLSGSGVGCTHSRSTGESARDWDKDEASQVEDVFYRDVVRIYHAGNHETVLQWINAHEESGRRGALWPRILIVKALAYLGLKRPAEAWSELNRVEPAADPGLSAELAYYRALTQFSLGELDSALLRARSIESALLTDALEVDRRILIARIYLKKKQWIEAAVEALATARTTPAAGGTLGPILEQALVKIERPGDIRALLKEFPRTAISDRLMYRMASIEHREGSSTEGDSLLRSLLLSFPKSPLAPSAERQLRQKRLEVPVEGLRVGVLLPRSGKLAPIGDRALLAIRMGIKTAPRLREKIVIVAEDCGETPESMVAALDRLVFEHRVLAVIGPITSNGLDPLARRAQVLGVPVLSLAKRDAPDLDYVFHAGVTLKHQIERLAEYAVKVQKKTRFALLYPKDGLGEAATSLFWESVERLGASVTAVASYSNEETDFRAVVDQLTGASQLEARSRESATLAAQRTSLKIKKRTRKNQKYFELPPLVDFDAVFVPDSLRVLGMVLPTFSYRDVDHMNFFGTSLWNAPEVLAPLAKDNATKPLWFVDVFSNPDPQALIARRFVDQFRELGNGAPGSVEALGFDAGAILADAIFRMDAAGSRDQLRRALLDKGQFDGVTGTVRLEGRTWDRDLTVYTVKEGQVTPAPSP